MKKIVFLIVAVFFFGVNCFAQNESKFKSLKDNLDKNEVATQHPKKGIDPKTWMDRGKLFQDAYNVNVGLLRFGMPATDLKLFFLGKNPIQVLTSEENGVLTETHEYNQIKINFENGVLKSWEETKEVVANPLSEAVKAYQKATSLDEKGKNVKKIKEAYRSINNDLETRLFNEYALLKFKAAHQTALDRVEVSKLLGINDTTYYFYAGFMAFAQSESDDSMWKESIDNLKKALALGYREMGESKGQIYDLLYNACIKTGDSIQALKFAKTGFELNPNYERLMYNLINYYLSRGENNKTLEYLEQAVARDPKNPNLLFAHGKVLDELGETEKSLAAYDASIAADPKYFDPYFNKAVVYYNNAVKLVEDAEKERVQSIYEAKINVANEEFAKAIPLLEKAHELRPDDTQTMDTLRSLYFRLRNKYPELEAKYHEMSKKLGKE